MIMICLQVFGYKLSEYGHESAPNVVMT